MRMIQDCDSAIDNGPLIMAILLDELQLTLAKLLTVFPMGTSSQNAMCIWFNCLPVKYHAVILLLTAVIYTTATTG